MSHACRECYEPVHDAGQELCDWCRMTEDERRLRTRRAWWIIVAAVTVTVFLIIGAEQ